MFWECLILFINIQQYFSLRKLAEELLKIIKNFL